MDRTVTASVRYIDPAWRDAAEPPRIGSGSSRRSTTSYYDVTIGDARSADEPFGLDTAGFQLASLPDPPLPADVVASRSAERGAYHRRVLDLVASVTGADRVLLLADLVRTEDRSDFNTAYSRFVHCDYSRDRFDAMTANLLQRRGVEPDPAWRYAWYNTWQPFDHPVAQDHLTMLDVRSLAPGDIIAYRYTGYTDDPGDEGGLVAAPVHNPRHQWWYYPAMSTDEILLTKQLDERPGRAEQCPHTSFTDPTAPADAPPRRSIEVRTLAVFADR